MFIQDSGLKGPDAGEDIYGVSMKLVVGMWLQLTLKPFCIAWHLL